MVAEAAGPLTRTSLRVVNAWPLCAPLGAQKPERSHARRLAHVSNEDEGHAVEVDASRR